MSYGFGELLRRYRAGEELTQQVLANLIGVTRNTIRDWEQGKRVPSREKVLALADALHIPSNELEIFLQAAGIGRKERVKQVWSYRELYNQLTGGLAGLPGSPLTGVEQFLFEYLGSSSNPIPFGGRQAQFDELDSWLFDQSDPYLLLLSEAGRGKSALLAHWVAEITKTQKADVVFIPISIRFGTALRSRSFGIIGSRLRFVHGVVGDQPHDPDLWLPEIDAYLRQDRPPSKPLVMVLDGVDEAADWICGQDIRFPPQPGNGVKVLVSARELVDCDVNGWIRRLRWNEYYRVMYLQLLDETGVAEVLQSTQESYIDTTTRIDIAKELFRLSGGDPLLLRLYVEALHSRGQDRAFLSAEELSSIEPGLSAYFASWWDDQKQQWLLQGRNPLEEQQVLIELLNLLATALGPLTYEDVMILLHGQVTTGLRLGLLFAEIGRFVVGDGRKNGIVFSHSRLGDFFLSQMTKTERDGWNMRFIELGERTVKDLDQGTLAVHDASKYIIQFFGAHIERIDANPELFFMLVSYGWLQSWLALEGSYEGFLSDMKRAWRRALDLSDNTNYERKCRYIALQVKYTLISASVNNIAQNIPPSIVAYLVKTGLWSSLQAISYIRRIPEEGDVPKYITSILDYCSENELREVYYIAYSIANIYYRLEIIEHLICYLSGDLLDDILADIKAVRAEWYKPQPPRLSRNPFVEITRETEKNRLYSEIMIGLCHRWAEIGELDRSLMHIDDVPRVAVSTNLGEGVREYQHPIVEAMIKVASFMPETKQDAMCRDALTIWREIDDDRWKVTYLLKVISFLPERIRTEALEEAVTIACAIEDLRWRAKIIRRLAPFLSKSNIDRVSTAAQELPNQHEYIVIVDGWDEKEECNPRSEAISGLIPQFFALGEFEVAYSLLSQIEDGELYVATIVSSIEFLPEHELINLFNVHIKKSMLNNSGDVILAMITRLCVLDRVEEMYKFVIEGEPPTILRDVFTSLRGRRYIGVEEIIAILPHQPRERQVAILSSVVEMLQRIRDTDEQENTIRAFAPYFPETELSLSLNYAITLGNENDMRFQSRAICDIAQHLTEPLLRQSLEIVDHMSDRYLHEWDQCRAWSTLLPRLAELGFVDEAVAETNRMIVLHYKSIALAKMSPYIGDNKHTSIISQALEAAWRAQNEELCDDAFAVVSSYLKDIPSRELIRSVKTTKKRRIRALAYISPYLDQKERNTILKLALREALRRPDFNAPYTDFVDSSPRSTAIAWLAKYLPEHILSMALTKVIAAYGYTFSSTITTADLLALILKIVSGEREKFSFSDDNWCFSESISGIISHLAKFGWERYTLDIAKHLTPRWRAEVLVNILPYIADEQRDRVANWALSSLDFISYVEVKLELLSRIYPYLSGDNLSIALWMARQYGPSKDAERTVAKLVCRLADFGQISDALEEIDAIKYPYGDGAREELSKYLSNTSIVDALNIALNIERSEHQEAALREAAINMSRISFDDCYRIWKEMLRVYSEANRGEVLLFIRAFAPVVAKLGGESCARQIAPIIREVGKWFP